MGEDMKNHTRRSLGILFLILLVIPTVATLSIPLRTLNLERRSIKKNFPVFRDEAFLQSSFPFDVAVISWSYPTETALFSVGDVDEDPYLEVVLANTLDSLSILDPYGLETSKDFSWRISRLFVGDVDQDNISEVVIFSYSDQLLSIWDVVTGEIASWRVEGVTPETMVPIHSSDGYFAIIFANKTHILMLNYSGLFLLHKFESPRTIWRSGVADVDGDSSLEYIFSTKDGEEAKIVVYDFDSQELLEISTSTVYSANLLRIDFDGDSVDEVFAYSATTFGLVDNNAERWVESANGTIIGADIIDVNQDGLMDIVLSIENNGLIIVRYPQIIEKIFDPLQTVPVVADFDGDKSFEIAGFCNNKLVLVNTSGEIEYSYPETLPPYGQFIKAADLEGDGLIDIIAPFTYWGTVKIGEFRFIRLPFKPIRISDQFSLPITYNVSEYHDYNALTSILTELSNRYPSKVEVSAIGESWQGRKIWLVKVTNGDGVEKPAILCIGAHHAREFITVENTLYTIMVLIALYGKDPVITQLLDNFDFYFVPMLNPDGVEIALKANDWQRKNARPVDDDGDGRVDEDPPEDLNGDGLIDVIYEYSEATGQWILNYEGIDNDGDGRSGEDWIGGVDLNRNYAFDWSNEELYGEKSSEIYAGPEPLSEPETQALDELMNTTRPLLAISLHSGTRAVLSPFAINYTLPFEQELFVELAGLASYVSGFPAMQLCTLYESYGSWDDHAYGYYNIFSVTIETFRNDSAFTYIFEKGKQILRGYRWYFNPEPSRIPEVNEIVAETFINVAHWMLKKILADQKPPEITSEDINVELHHNYVIISARPIDYESGIHKVLARVKTSEGIKEGEMFKDIEHRVWVTRIDSISNMIEEVYIIIEDKAGHVTEFSLSNVTDNIGPDLVKLWYKPRKPRIIDKINVYAIVKDFSGVKEVVLQYSIAGTNNWSNITMVYEEDKDYYIGTIPALVNISSGIPTVNESSAVVEFRIMAVDVWGNPSKSKTFIILVSSDLEGPEISVRLVPRAPSMFDSVKVYADISDKSGVDKVIMSYWNGKEWINVTMERIDYSTYLGEIPPLKAFTKVIIRIIANDTVGNKSVKSLEYIVKPLPLRYMIVAIITIVAILIVLIYYRRERRKR